MFHQSLKQSQNNYLDDRGIALPTVIITAVLALAAATAGVIIYNVVRDRGSDLDTSTASAISGIKTSFDSAVPNLGREGGGNQVVSPPMAEEDDETAPTLNAQNELEAGMSYDLYLATKICPNLETKLWYAKIASGKDTLERKNPIESAGENVTLSPKTTATGCEYQSTDHGIYETAAQKTAGVSALSSDGTSTATTTCIRPSLKKLTAKNTCKLSFSGTATSGVADVIGIGNRASWQLISYCAIKGGYLPQVETSATVTYATTSNYNKCVFKDSSNCTQNAQNRLGFEIDSTAVTNISVTATDSVCTVSETARPSANTVSIGVEMTAGDKKNEASYTALPTPSACPKWGETGTKLTAETPFVANKCSYTTTDCATKGLKADGAGKCAFTVSTATPECPTIFRVDKTSGERSCQRKVGEVSLNFYTICGGWASTAGPTFDHDNDGGTTPAVAEQSSEVYAYYDTTNQTYHCSFKNRFTNSARECQSFGYIPKAGGECEYVVGTTFNPRPYRPKCPEIRALPYKTSQEQLWSLTNMNLVERGGTASSPVASKPYFVSRTGSYLYPNIQQQVDEWYNHLQAPAIAALDSSHQYNELWYPTDYPTGNVIRSQTYSTTGFGKPITTTATARTDFGTADGTYLLSASTGESSSGYIPNYLAPDATDAACDQYKQFHHAVNFEQRPSTGHGRPSTATKEWILGFNNGTRLESCKNTGNGNLNINSNSTTVVWEPRYYLDVATTGNLPTSHHCKIDPTGLGTGTGRLTNSHCQVIGTVYKECALIGSDGSFSRPSDAIPDKPSNSLTNAENAYIKACTDYGYHSGSTPNLFDIKGVGGTADPLSTSFNSVGLSDTNIRTTYGLSKAPNTNQYGLLNVSWVRSDINTATLKAWKTGTKYLGFGVGEIWQYITGTGSGATPQLRTALNYNSGGSNSTFPLTNHNYLEIATGRNIAFDYTRIHGTNGGSHWPLYMPSTEEQCEFKVPTTASATERGFFQACQALSTYFPVRLSYHKPIETKNFSVTSVSYTLTLNSTTKQLSSSLPGGEYGHWRSALTGTKDPALAKYGSASYNSPTYFHIKTNASNGYHYCEANPVVTTTNPVLPMTAKAGVYTATKVPGTTVANSKCKLLNDVLGITTTSSKTFEAVSEAAEATTNGAATVSAEGFVGHKEGPRDYYPCKWIAPFRGNGTN